MVSVERDSTGPETLDRGNRDFVDEGESVIIEPEDGDGRGM